MRNERIRKRAPAPAAADANVVKRPKGVKPVGPRHILIRDLILSCNIGVYAHERGRTQRVRLNLDLAVSPGRQPHYDRLANVVCYEEIVDRVRAITTAGHINLVETLAERIAADCLAIPSCREVRVRVEKLDVIPAAASVGVEILWRRS